MGLNNIGFFDILSQDNKVKGHHYMGQEEIKLLWLITQQIYCITGDNIPNTPVDQKGTLTVIKQVRYELESEEDCEQPFQLLHQVLSSLLLMQIMPIQASLAVHLLVHKEALTQDIMLQMRSTWMEQIVGQLRTAFDNPNILHHVQASGDCSLVDNSENAVAQGDISAGET